MVRDAAAVRARLGHDQPGAHGSGVPTEIGRYLRRKATFPIERADEFVHVHDGRLEFDCHDRAGSIVPGEQIDDSSLAIDRERPLRDHDPAGLPGDPGRDNLCQRRMASAGDPVELGVGGSREHLEADPKLRGHGSEFTE